MAGIHDLIALKDTLSAKFLSTVVSRVVTRFSTGVSAEPKQNVVGIGVGKKITEGDETATPCIRFYVVDKIHKNNLTSRQLLPSSIDGVPTDVIATGRFRLLDTAETNKTRRRPIRPGTSIGFQFPPPDEDLRMAGTFGAVVTKNRKNYILSNNHVLSENGLVPVGSPIYQPGLLDGGHVPDGAEATVGDRVATVSKVVPIKQRGANRVDCAIAEISRDVAFDPKHMPNVGAMASPKPIAAEENMEVMKTGRTTGHTIGRVVDASVDVVVPYNDKNGVEFLARFANQIMVVGSPNPGGFSAAGDSGSLIVDRATRRATGLLFAGSSSHTLANRIEDVLTALGVTLVTI